MACAYRLRTQLRPDLQVGGTWTYLGYHPSNKNSISTSNVPTIGITLIDSATDDPLAVTATASVGWYGYEYEFDDKCSTTFTTNVYLQVTDSQTEYEICDYWLDWSPKYIVNQTILNYLRISSFKVNDVEYLPLPISLGTFSLYMLEGTICEAITDHNYVKNFCDTLNNVGIPGFTFVYSDREEDNPIYTCSGYKYHTIYYPTNSTFEIVFQEDFSFGSGTNWRNHSKWDQDSSYKWNNGTQAWIDQAECTSCSGETLADNIVKVCL